MPDPRVRVLADDYWEAFLEANPTSATLLGDHRFDDRIEDLSAAGAEAQRRRWVDLQRRLGAIDRSALDLDDRVTCRQLDQELRDSVAAIEDRLMELQSDQMTGYHVGLLVTSSLVSAPDPEAAWKLVARLRQVPRALEQAGQRFREGLAAGRTPARVCIDRSLNVMEGYLASSLASDVFTQIRGPEDWDGEEKWRQALGEAATDAVRPGYQHLARVLREDLLPKARDDDHAGLRWIDDGDAMYATWMRLHTTTDLTAEEVHQFGMEDVTEKLPSEYASVAGRLFGVTAADDIFRRLRDDQTLRYQTPEEIMDSARGMLAAASAEMGNWFGRLPQTECAIEAVPAILAADTPSAYYMPPAPDGSRPGTYFVNTHSPSDKARYEAASVAFHEAIPGHHLQLTIASEMTQLPSFRRFSEANNAFCEGWGLYAERLADEMGLYPGDLDRVGMLSADSLRSCRLVVDTGLHAMGWSRERAIQFMASHTPLSRAEVEVEVDRYIAMPAQALAYKVGQRQIFRLRDDATAALGAHFDIKGFHDAVLGSGSVGLPVLAQVVHDWMARQS
jgi:uncharacterized protein (DUF885 family)